MIDRIKLLMRSQKLNATQFAEEIGIQRSALSHVMSGRNKPSLDFMMKIKSRFNKVSLDWLLLGEGDMLGVEENDNFESEFSSVDQFHQPEVGKSYAKPNVKSPQEDTSLKKVVVGNRSLTTEGGEIQQVILLYADGTFHTYQPK